MMNNKKDDIKMKYEKPDLEEIELILEGSFLKNSTTIEKDPDPWGGEFDD